MAVPAKNEAEYLPALLRALARQTWFNRSGSRLEVVLVLNNCDDASAAIIRDCARELTPLALTVFDVTLTPPSANVGTARRLAMDAALTEVRIAAPLVPLYANVDAAPIADPGQIRAGLVAQVTGMVRWRESVLAMAAAGVTEFVEFGGKVLAPMVKRIAPDVDAVSIVTMDDLDAVVAKL